MDTKRSLIKKLPKYIMLGHGLYSSSPKVFVVPDDKIYIFLSKSSRYLPQSIITPEFYKYFRTLTGPGPKILEGWQQRVYGPGDQCSDIGLSFVDPVWPGMGIHKLPLKADAFKTTPGDLAGTSGTLSNLNGPPGVYFIVSCRAISGQSILYQNQSATYIFPKGSTHQRVQNEDTASARLNKRRREQGTALRKVPSELTQVTKKRKINTSK